MKLNYKKSTKVKISIFSIMLCILGYIFISISLYEAQYPEWCNLKKIITSEYRNINKFYISNYGPYCKFTIITRKQIQLADAETIFIQIKEYISKTTFKQEMSERHMKEVHGEIGVIAIEFKNHASVDSAYSFSSTNSSNFNEWTQKY
jgi:hypothetical protein